MYSKTRVVMGAAKYGFRFFMCLGTGCDYVSIDIRDSIGFAL
jgi:hypothetical protein